MSHTFTGTIDRALWRSDKTSWALTLVEPDSQFVQNLNDNKPKVEGSNRYKEDSKYLKCAGPIVSTMPGVYLEITGDWYDDPKYGLQFKIDQSRLMDGIVSEKISKEGLAKLLCAFRGIGPMTAKSIVNAPFFPEPKDVVNDLKDSGAKIRGIVGEELFNNIMEGWSGLADKATVLSFLYSNGFGQAIADRIVLFYHETDKRPYDAIPALIKANPYRLIDDIRGISFTTADKLAINLGFALDGLFRKIACLQFVLEEAAKESGSTFLVESEAHLRCLKLIGQGMIRLFDSDEGWGIEEEGQDKAIAEWKDAWGDTPYMDIRPPSLLEGEDISDRFTTVTVSGSNYRFVTLTRLLKSEVCIADTIEKLMNA